MTVTVFSQYPDLSPPTCTIINQTGTCAGVYGRPECVSSTWQVRVMFVDAGEGLLSVTTRENRNGTLKGSRELAGSYNLDMKWDKGRVSRSLKNILAPKTHL